MTLNLIFCFSEWDLFAKGEYERLAMEEEGGDDSEMMDAMDGWDSEEESTPQAGADSTNTGVAATEATTPASTDNTKVDAG